MQKPVIVNAAVEGPTDEAVIRKLISHVGAEPGPVYGKKGKPDLKKNIAGFNFAARHAPWIVLVDLDQDAACAPPLLIDWLPAPVRQLCFRVAVHAIEAWLMADAAALAQFLDVARGKVPTNPDAVLDPKQVLVNLARTSRKKPIRQDMVPRESGGRAVGPAYTSRVIEFATNYWRPAEAAHHSDSLRRAIACLRNLVNDA